MNKKYSARDITYIGLMSASLTVVKLALSWIANVELVTLLIVFYALKFGKAKTFCACNVFILVECFLYGFGTWVISYLIHWNALIFACAIFNKLKVKKSVYFALLALGMTFLFGIQTTLIDLFIYSPKTNFLSAFITRYYMGLSFFITHMISAFVSVLLLLPALIRIEFGDNIQEKEN